MDQKNEVILIVDVETTGLNPSDQVIELAVQKGLTPDSWNKSWRFKPSIPIPKQATAIHGIKDEDLADCPPFSAALEMIRKIFTGSDIIVGYNIAFDLKMIQAEFQRAGVAPLDLKGKSIIDPHRLWSRCEPRSLEAAVQRFAKREHTGAHAALADIAATGEVLSGMLKEFGLSDQSWKDLADFIEPERKNWVGSTEHIVWKDQTLVFGFGKHYGKDVFQVIKEDVSYSRWIASKDFPEHVKNIVTKAAVTEKTEFLIWAQSFLAPEPK